MGTSYSPHKRLTWTYTTALAILAILAIFGYIIIRLYINSESGISRIINVSSRQRMLSQRIAYKAVILKHTLDKYHASATIKEIESLASTWEKIHKGLQQGDGDLELSNKYNTQAIRDLYSNLQVYYAPISKACHTIFQHQAYTPQDKSVINLAIETILLYEADYLKIMDDITFIYDEQAKEKLTDLENIQLGLTIFIIVVLLLEIFIIFRPACATIKKYFDDLGATNQALAKAYTQLQAREEEVLRSTKVLENTNTLLVKSQDELKELNLAKDKFFSIIAHDLKSPINSLKGFTNLLANFTDSLSKEEIKLLADDLDKCISNLFDFLNNLLTWARMQMNNIEAVPQQLDLKEIVDKHITLFSMNAKSKNINLYAEIEQSCMVYMDENALNTVIGNLISNALKFTLPKGTIKLKANYQPQSGFMALSITDTGVGMTPETLEKILKLDSKHTTQGTFGEKGTGLGLILCKEFIEKNGGTLTVESELNKGTTFHCLIPLARKAHAPAA